LKKTKGKSVRLGGYTKCNTTSKAQYINKKYEEAEVQLENQSVILEIYLEKQDFLPMGINHTKVTGKQPDVDGNQKWVLPHGMVLQVEDFYVEEPLYEGDRQITHMILSNKINMTAITLVDKELARDKINKIVADKIKEKETTIEDSRKVLNDNLKHFSNQEKSVAMKCLVEFGFENFYNIKDQQLVKVFIENQFDHTIEFMHEDMISYFNLITKSQITFQTERQFPRYYNAKVTTKDKKVFLIGDKKTFEFYLTINKLEDRAEMKVEREATAIAYEPTLDKIYALGGQYTDTCE